MRRLCSECCLCKFTGCLADRIPDYWSVIGHDMLCTVHIGFLGRFAGQFAE